MIFHPKQFTKTDGSYRLPRFTKATCHPCLCKPIFGEFWHNFSLQFSELSSDATDKFVFSVGNAERLPLEGFSYSVRVTPQGICVYAESERDLCHGFMTLLDRMGVNEDGDAAEIACCEIRDRASIADRMVHFCIFPETEPWELQRFLRLCGALKYTHVVLEFWGMLRLDCMKELAWRHAYTKEQIKPIIREARELGLEIIPMFNHWGHASAGRVMHGKHVVLDQNPSLQSYFSEDGWCWNIAKPRVRALMRQIREELIELCGEGQYFHIGCDEAYGFEFTEQSMRHLSDYINEISEDLQAQNRRAIMWGDMMLYRHAHYNPSNRYTCNAPTPDVERYFLEHLDKSIIIADWQYRAPEAPVETCSVFQKAGFDCLICPWDEGVGQINAAFATAARQSLMGYMHTTWHTLSAGMPYVTGMAVGGWEFREDYHVTLHRTQTAALLRRVMPSCGDYERSGWSKFEISDRW